MSIRYGIATDYDTNEKSKRDNLTIWSGAYMSNYEGYAVSLPNRDGYMVHLDYGKTRKIRVTCPVGRTEADYEQIDAAINAAINAANA